MRSYFPLILATLCLGCAPSANERVAPIAQPRHPSLPSAPASQGSPPVAVSPPLALSDEAACALTPSGTGKALPSAQPFRGESGSCLPDHGFCDTAEVPPDGADSCFVAAPNIARAERDAPSATGARTSSAPWDGATAPRYLERIDAHLHLTPHEHELLRANGFVVLDRLAYTSYANAFHDIFQEQLPLYVGIDPILHAVFRGTESALEHIELTRLRPALYRLIKKLRASLARSTSRYDDETRRDLDVYLGVAWSLTGVSSRTEETPKLSLFGQDDAVGELARMATGATELSEVELFGRSRMVDFSQLVPRGHYETGGNYENDLSGYFQATMWLARLEFNLVSRGCRSSQPGAVPDPRETPREARDAMALADLVERSGAAAELKLFDDVYSSFAGRREDIPPAELSRLMHANHIQLSDREGFDKLKTAIGDGYRRSARVHFMPQGSGELPAIFTLLGPRIVPDIAPLTRLVHDAVPDRTSLGAPDIAYLMGHDRAKSYLAHDLKTWPGLGAALDDARTELRNQATASHDVYGAWLRALLAVGVRPSGIVPSFMHKPAYDDARMNSALVGYGQLRHAFVLLAAQGYDAYGCEIPDAWVEPLPDVYRALLTHVQGMRAQTTGWAGLYRVLGMLNTIVRTEVSGTALSEPQRRWLSMVAENVPVGGFSDSGEPPKWTGWYFDMFEDREHGASKAPAFIADYFTLTNKGVVEYLGADGPRLGVFIVDVGGEPRALVGPVAKGFQAESPIARRLDDDASLSLQDKSAPWRASFAPPPAEPPRLGLQGRVVRCGEASARPEWRLIVRSDRPVSAARVTLLDHHADPITEPMALATSSTWKAYVFELPDAVASARWGIEAIHLRVDDAGGAQGWDYFSSPSFYQSSEVTPDELPARPRGLAPFAVGGPLPEVPAARSQPEPYPM